MWIHFCDNFYQKWTRLTRDTKNIEVQIFQEFLFLSKSGLVDKFYIGSVTVTLGQIIYLCYQLACKKNNGSVGR